MLKRFKLSDILTVFACIIVFCLLMQGWDSIVSFIGLVLSSIIPLLLGTAIAYIVSIPTKFYMRHFFPNSTSPLVNSIRKPVCLAVTVIILIAVIAFCSSVLIPALIETVTMLQQNGPRFIQELIAMPAFKIVRQPLSNFLDSEIMQSLLELDIPGVVQSLFGGTMGSLTTHVFGVIGAIMTGFFGIMFAFILLTDPNNTPGKLMPLFAEYLGAERTRRISELMGVADASFHSFIVRQSLEAVILGTVGTFTLIIAGFPYALGVGALVGLCALVPIVGYPVGLVLSTLLVAINNLWTAPVFLIAVFVAQMLESTFLLPHIGDPRTALTPMWVMVGVTIGGGIAGFVGMLVAIPITSTIRQLVLRNYKRRVYVRERAEKMEQEALMAKAEEAKAPEDDEKDAASGSAPTSSEEEQR